MIRAHVRAGALAVLLALGGCSVFGGQAAEEPPYELLVSEPPFEIRAYPPVTVARTTVDAPYDEAVNEGFRRLFGYITGANRGAAEIEMTAPVLAEPEGAEIAMTAPVLVEPDGAEIDMTAPVLVEPDQPAEPSAEGWTVAFVLPGGMTPATAPVPTDPRVSIAELPARRVGVARYSGFFTERKAEENAAALLAWLAERDERPAGAWSAAGYNPPWTLPPLRRNEVLVPLTPPGG